jgi:dipeptidyl aminopeptidase/acylaminoacyl peptidase
MTNRWGATASEPFNLLPNFGLALLFMPFAGRDGLGPAAFNALAAERNFGQLDIAEAAQVARTMKARGYTTHGQLGITGCSYGGYFTSQSISRYPYLYAAANGQCLLLDLHQWLEAPGGTPNLGALYMEGRLVTDEPEEYNKDSPLYQAGKVRTPLLLFHGTQDLYPLDTAVQFHDQVEAAGTPVTLLAFEGEGHELMAPTSRALAAQWQIWWFRTYLTPPPRS